EDLNESGNLDFSASTSGGDKIIIKALDLMAGSSLGGQMMNLQLLATEDPLVYRGLITMQTGVGDTEADDVTTNIGGIEFTSDKNPGYDQKKELEGKTDEDLEKEIEEAMKKTVSGSADYGITITGYFEVEVRYDNKKDKWSIVVIGGGFDLDALVGYTWTANTMVGPIPVTGELGIGAAMKLEFRAVKPYGNVPADINAADVNDFMTALRIKLYINAFGGFGFDYSIIALKIGVFGEIDLTFSNEFLNRSYLAPHPLGYDKLWAGRLTSSGRVGVKFVAKFLFFSYQAVIASAGYSDEELWSSGDTELIDEWKNGQSSNMLKSAGHSRFIKKYALGGGLGAVKETAGLEDRSYLSLYERVWGNKAKAGMGDLNTYGISGTPGISTASGMADIQTNSYPYANPVVTSDGAILAFMSDSGSTDLNETRASWAMANDSGGYGSPAAFMQEPAEKAYADNNIKIDGTKDFAVAAWERQRVQIMMDGSLSNEDLSAMISSSDIMVSVFNGSTWTTTSLTDNMVSDMAPVVAAKDGRAIVAWRSVAGNDMPGNPMIYDNADDSVLYRIYKNGIWSETHNLYNGASGNVKGLSAAIMSDGTSAIAYTLDCGTENENPALGYETVCAVVDSDDNLITNLRLTNNDSADENPQIAAVDFRAEECGEKFVIGWYNATLEGASDIKLAAVDSSGNIYNGFIDSISSVNENSAVKVGGNFRFVKGVNIGINDLSLVWTEKYMDYDEQIDSNAEKDCLKAVKFMRDENGKIYLSAVLDVAVMDDYTLIDHFDAFAGEKNTVHAVMLASSYTGELIDEGNGFYTRGSICSMKSASAVFENGISVQNIYVDYDEIRNDFTAPIQFTIVNMGITPVNSIKIELLPDEVIETFTGLNILPNQAMVLNVNYTVPGALTGIHDLDYMVEATFSNSDVAEKTGKLNLDVPDTGISRVELISDEQGKRVVQATLQNLSNVPLAGASNRKVYAGFYTSPEYLGESIVDVREITGDDLLLLDKSALTMRFTYTVPPTGIPKGGIRLYGRIWTEEKQLDDTYDEIIEYYQENNARSILLPNPIEANNGNQFLVTVEQENRVSQTTAFITVKNLSMTPSVNGNLMAYLMDVDSKIIETKLLAKTAGELIALSGEESITKEFIFSRLGDRVVCEYFTTDPEAMDAGLSDIKLHGIGIDFNSAITDYSLVSENLGSTVIAATAKGLGDAVEIRSGSGTLLARGTGAVTYTLQLPYGRTSVKITVTPAAKGIEPKTYNISITNSQSSDGTIFIKTEDANNKSASILVTAENLNNFIPATWKFMKNGEWSRLNTWENDKRNKFVASGSGSIVVRVRVFDENGYYMDSNTLSLYHGPSGDNNNDETIPDPEIIEEDIPASPVSFTDVKEGEWYYEAIQYVVNAKLFNGVGNNRFAPDDEMTRAMFVTVLGRVYESRGGTVKAGTCSFADVKTGQWYTEYIVWAEQNKLVNGYGGGLFGTDDSITREQLAVLISRFVEYIGVKLPADNSTASFTDGSSISSYAAEEVQRVWQAGLMQGRTDGSFDPSGTATRAEVAIVFMRLMKLLEK
ncbi:MAG: S-layer homology domain-containing protein, partial [Clostridiaceae bacterium]